MTEVQLFSTCLAEEFFPEVNDAAATVLERLRLKVTPVRGAFCCGQVAFNEGMREEAVELASRFLNSVEPNIPIFVLYDTGTSEIYTFSVHDALPVRAYGRKAAGLGLGRER